MNVLNLQTKPNEISTNQDTLTPEYLDWQGKLIGVLTDKIRSKLYKRYKEETGLDSWIKSENSESSQIEEDNYTPQKCVIKISKFPETQVRVPNKISNSPIYPNKTCLYQYAIEHKIDPDKFSVITEAEKKRWSMGCFRGDLERDIRFYRGGMKIPENIINS